jgi:regulator of sigma D
MIISKEAKIGAVFFIAIAVFLVFAVAVGVLPLGGRQQMVVYFDKVYGLQPGNDVWVNGNSYGSVQSLETVTVPVKDEETGKIEKAIMIKVVLSVPHVVTLHEGYNISVVDKSVIGGRAVDIMPGPPDNPPYTGMIHGTSLGTIASIQGRISTALDEMMLSEGTFRQLVKQREVYDKTVTVLDEAAKTLQLLTDEHSNYRRIMTDPHFADDLTGAVAELRKASDEIANYAEKMNAPNSFANRLATDETLFPRLEAITQNLEAFTRKLNEGEGMGRLLTDQELYRDIRDIVAELRQTARVASKFISELEGDPQMLIAGRHSQNETWLVQQLRGPKPAAPPAPVDERKLVPQD